MRVEITQQPVFRPTSITIHIETQEELDVLRSMRASVSKQPSQTPRHDLTQRVQNQFQAALQSI